MIYLPSKLLFSLSSISFMIPLCTSLLSFHAESELGIALLGTDLPLRLHLSPCFITLTLHFSFKLFSVRAAYSGLSLPGILSDPSLKKNNSDIKMSLSFSQAMKTSNDSLLI